MSIFRLFLKLQMKKLFLQRGEGVSFYSHLDRSSIDLMGAAIDSRKRCITQVLGIEFVPLEISQIAAFSIWIRYI